MVLSARRFTHDRPDTATMAIQSHRRKTWGKNLEHGLEHGLEHDLEQSLEPLTPSRPYRITAAAAGAD